MLLGSPTNTAAISAFLTFSDAARRVKTLYASKGVSSDVSPQEPSRRQPNSPLWSFDPGSLITPITGFLTAAKATTVQTSATFNAADQALASSLERAFISTNIRLVSYPSAAEFKKGNQDIDALFTDIATAKATSGTKDSSEAEKARITQLDKQVADLQAVVVNAKPDSAFPVILLGTALLESLTLPKDTKPKKTEAKGVDLYNTEYHSLTVNNDVAGGGTRANTYFLVNLFVPAPHPSYNGGAVVSYTFRDTDGDAMAAGTLRFVFGYGKWHSPSLRAKQSEEGYANFPWLGKGARGHWIKWW